MSEHSPHITVLGAPLPTGPEAKLRALSRSWQAMLAPWLAPAQREHLEAFALNGPALTARLSRQLARLLLLWAVGKRQGQPHALAGGSHGPPMLSGWFTTCSHSAHAAFCALLPQPPSGAMRGLAVDAEAMQASPPAPRAFAPGELHWLPGRSGLERVGNMEQGILRCDALRRWTIKEACLKALGRGLTQDPQSICSGQAGQRSGFMPDSGNGSLRWQLVPFPGHWLCVALRLAMPAPMPALDCAWLAAPPLDAVQTPSASRMAATRLA